MQVIKSRLELLSIACQLDTDFPGMKLHQDRVAFIKQHLSNSQSIS